MAGKERRVGGGDNYMNAYVPLAPSRYLHSQHTMLFFVNRGAANSTIHASALEVQPHLPVLSVFANYGKTKDNTGYYNFAKQAR